MKRITKPTAKKATKQERDIKKHRENRAYVTATMVMLMTHVDNTAATVHLSSDDYCFKPVFNPKDYRMLIVATVGEIIISRIRCSEQVESNSIYEELLGIPDPRCYMDRMTAEEVKHIVVSTMLQVARATHAIDSIAEQLLAIPQEQSTVVFPPVKTA